MAPTSSTPLLADDARRQSQDSNDSDTRAEREDNALHNDGSATATHKSRSSSPRWQTRLREIVLFLWALFATVGMIVLAAILQHRSQIGTSPPPPSHSPSNPNPTSAPSNNVTTKRNLIFMVSDGMGPTTLSLTRSYRQHVLNLPLNDTLTLDKHFWGTSRTRSSNSLVTDSAAGATAFSCGEKSYNGAISMLPDHTPCGSVMEAAKRAGYTTGLVVTTDITDATPAVWVSHVDQRVEEDEIALQEIGEGVLGRNVDLMLGGGRCHFLPNGTDGSCRADEVDVVDLAKRRHGWSWFDDRSGFEKFAKGQVELPALGLFARHDVPFEIDRRKQNDVYPSLSEMAGAALRALEKATEESEKGFFLMIEGSLIDHCGHVNDPACQVHETLEFDRTFKMVLDFLKRSETPGVLVSTSDHETGGLSTAWQSQAAPLPVYNWHPQVLARANSSTEYLSQQLRAHIAATIPSPLEASDVPSTLKLRDWINTNIIIAGLGITDARDSELDYLAQYPILATNTLSQMISQRARIGWSTRGHSAVDVNIYSSGGPGTEALRGNVENTQVGEFLRGYLDVEVEDVTRELREKMPDWERRRRSRSAGMSTSANNESSGLDLR